MKILLISRNSPFESIGGIERYLDNLLAYFKSNKNIKYHLYLMIPSNEGNHREKMENATIFYNQSLFITRNKFTSREMIANSEKFTEDVINIINECEIDIICAENFHTDLPASYNLSLNMITMSYQIPLVLQLHSFAETQLQTELINQLRWDEISCVSKSIAGDCFQKGSDINVLSTHYLGVNTDEFNSNSMKNNLLKKSLTLHDDAKIILTATRIIRGQKNILREKGLVNLIESFSKLSSRHSKLYLLIAIGKPPENLKEEFNMAYEMLQGYIKLHNVKERTILKMYSLHEMPDVYKGSDVFALPSENETFGQVFLEAMSCSVPVIGTKVGGIPEIISDSYNGYLVNPADASILAQKIELILNNRNMSEKFIAAGLKTVRDRFTSTQQITNFLNMLENVCSDFNISKNLSG